MGGETSGFRGDRIAAVRASQSCSVDDDMTLNGRLPKDEGGGKIRPLRLDAGGEPVSGDATCLRRGIGRFWKETASPPRDMSGERKEPKEPIRCGAGISCCRPGGLGRTAHPKSRTFNNTHRIRNAPAAGSTGVVDLG